MSTTINNKTAWPRTTPVVLIVVALLNWTTVALALDTCDYIDNAGDYCNALSSEDRRDCDQDGLTDYNECQGFDTPAVDGTPRHLNGYISAGPDKLNPVVPDLFYILSKPGGYDLDPGSLLLAAFGNNPDQALSIYSGDLKIQTHSIAYLDCGQDRLLTDDPFIVRAAWIIEAPSNSTGDNLDIGTTKPSHVTPNFPDVYSTIYTSRIQAHVDSNCSPNGTYPVCAIKGTNPSITNEGGDISPIVNYYIRQVVSHEIGHGTKLANTSAKSYYHYRRSGTIMDPSASFSRGVYDIPARFDLDSDPAHAKLYE